MSDPVNEPLEPLAIRVDEAERVSGLDRVTLYRLNAKGALIFRKAGRRTLVDYASLRQCLAPLPEMRGHSGLRRQTRTIDPIAARSLADLVGRRT